MKTFVVAALCVACAVPASAQFAEPKSWTGFYVGARAGFSPQLPDGDETIAFDTNLDGNFNDTVRTTTGANAFSPGFCGGRGVSTTPAAGCAKDEDSLDLALYAGYDFDLGGFVVGAIAEVGMGYSEDSVTAFSTTPASYTMTRRMKENASVRARAGYAFGQQRNTLVYGTGGIVFAKMSNTLTSTNTANAYALSGDDSVMGYRIGGGVEQRVHRNISIGLQYLFTSLADDGARVRVSRGTQPATNPFILANASGTDFARTHSKFATHNVSATVNFRF
jgi:outer membrane immunogenic protein